MDKIEDDQTHNLIDGFLSNERHTHEVKCQEPGCMAAGSIKCELPGNYNEQTQQTEPDTYEYFCAEHAGDNGYCHCCGTFIAGWIQFGTLCDNCRDELEANDADYDDDDFTPELFMTDQQPDGIIISISQKMLKEKGYRNWLRNFLQTMQLHELEYTYWMRQGAKPKLDKHLQFVYLCIGNKVRFRTYYAGTEGPCSKTFADGNGGVKEMFARAWIILSGPVERSAAGIPMKGFRGFRYTEKLF